MIPHQLDLITMHKSFGTTITSGLGALDNQSALWYSLTHRLGNLRSKDSFFNLFSNPRVINPIHESNTMTEQIVANADNTVDTKEFSFRFKKDKLGNQRPSVKLAVKVPSVEGLVSILEKGGKGLELLLEVVSDTVRGALAGYVADDEKISQETVPHDKLTWEAIATAPRAERKTIADEIWEAFAKDYIEVMPGVTGKSADAVTNATVVFLKKFSIVKTNKEVLAKLKEQLGLYMEHSKKAEEFSEVLELLTSKVDTYLKANDVELLVQNL